METRQQKLIREALEQSATRAQVSGPERVGDEPDSASLQEQALAHTGADYVPRTLTPYEWETFYATRGVPATHRHVARSPRKPGLWRRLWQVIWSH